MRIRPVHTESDHKAALKEISRLMESDPEPGTPDGDRLDILATLVESYEARHFPIDLPDPIEAIKFRMEQGGLTPKDLEPMIGRLNRVYEILNRKRALTLPMIWRLHSELGIPADSLIQPSSPA
jgi:HTH-type transcriptional regulator / antitoxin HigA